MGYSATLVSGRPFTITDPSAVLVALSTKDRISWCHPFVEYMIDAAAATDTVDEGNALALANILTDYGFEADWHTETYVEVTGWGGDKVGSDWEFVWKAIAKGVDSRVGWLFVGEDDAIFLVTAEFGEYKESVVSDLVDTVLAAAKEQQTAGTSNGEG